MSERGSFVTEYIYCKKCFEAAKKVLLDAEKYLHSCVIPAGDGFMPIIAGKIGGLGPGDEQYKLHFELAPLLSERICHKMRIAVLADSGQTILLIFSDGKGYKVIHESVFRNKDDSMKFSDNTGAWENVWR
jgi:hypothetical protein